MANKVTLDALIPREDFAVQSDPAPGVPQDRIGVNHLKDPFFGICSESLTSSVRPTIGHRRRWLI